MQKESIRGPALRRLAQANRKRYNGLCGGVIARASRGQSLMVFKSKQLNDQH
jgi:hypothetical protein